MMTASDLFNDDNRFNILYIQMLETMNIMDLDVVLLSELKRFIINRILLKFMWLLNINYVPCLQP